VRAGDAAIRRQIRVSIGRAGLPLGSLVYFRQGRREHTVYSYDPGWLDGRERFNVSADLQLLPGHQPHKAAAPQDLRQLWRRLAFNLLITNVDDHLQNHGFLHVAHGQWRLAPAFDINPFPEKDRESKTWLSEEDGPITDVAMLLARAATFGLDETRALAVLGEVHGAVARWRTIALSGEVGVLPAELDDFAPAFEHGQMDAVARLLGR
jgi:serine/threonine-protein kinase HipA